MQESESLFDMVLDQPVPPMPRATPIDSGLGWTDELTLWHHPEIVRDSLRRAGLSEHSELQSSEIRRARKAAEVFPDRNTPAARIREYIIPRIEG